MEYLKYGDKFSLFNKADSKWKGYYLTVIEDSSLNKPTFCQASPENVKNSADYLWVAMPAPDSTKKYGDYVETNDLLWLKNIDAAGVERYISIMWHDSPASANYVGALPGIPVQSPDQDNMGLWHLTFNDESKPESPQKIPLDDNTSVYIAHAPLPDSLVPDATLYIVISLDQSDLEPKFPDGVLMANRWLTSEWGIKSGNSSTNNGGPGNSGGPANNGGPGNQGGPQGDTKPRQIPGIPANTEFTITLINNESWLRSAKLNIDGNEVILDVGAKSAISKAYKTAKGNVTVSLLDSQHGLMLIPLKLESSNIGDTGKTVSFGAEKPKDETRPGYMDVFVHIDWATDITL